MKWSDCAVQDLTKYNGLKSSIENIKERIEVLEMRFDGMKAINMSDEIKAASDKLWDDRLTDNIVERERLKLLLEADIRMIALIDRGLGYLDETEKNVLMYFYIDKQLNHVESLKEKLNIEKSQIYRVKSQALYKFTSHMYGLEEL